MLNKANDLDGSVTYYNKVSLVVPITLNKNDSVRNYTISELPYTFQHLQVYKHVLRDKIIYLDTKSPSST